MTPLEAAARELCICAGDDPDRITSPQDRNRDARVVQALAVESWMNYRPDARAAISAYLKACAEDEDTLFALGECADCEMASQVRIGESISYANVGCAVIRELEPKE